MLTLVLFSSQSSLLIAAETNNNPDVILSIDVTGNHFVEKKTILAKLQTKVGQKLDRRKLSRDVRHLYKTGFFSDISFIGSKTKRGIKLTCKVKEFPLIANITISGNEEHSSKDLQLRMKLKPGRIFNPVNRRKDRNTLIKGYLKKGFYQVKVTFIPTELKDGRINLLIKIHEGEVTRINRIHIIGNKDFSDNTLRGQIASKQPDVTTMMNSRDVFDQKRFGADGQMLQQFYMNNGYLDMKIESKQITVAEDKKSFSLTFSVHEGSPYTVSSVEIQGDLVPDLQTLKDLVELETDKTYVLSDMQTSIAAITARVGDEGYAFASVTPLLNRNIDDHTVAVTFDIEKGKQVYIERIDISGNEKSNDEIVRRLLIQNEGARYSGSQIKTSKEALIRAPFVEDVRISHPKGSAPDKVRMKVDITEKKTGSISGGMGFSQREKVILTAKVSESNLFGKGYQASLNGQYGRITQDINASLTDPFFLGSNISASINVFKQQTDPLTTVTYRTESVGGGLTFGLPITHKVSYGISYRINSTNLLQVPVNSSILTLSQQGKQTIGEIIQSLSWDTRNRFISTTSGHVQSLTFGVSGVGGKTRFWESSFSSKAYFPFGEDDQFVINPSFSGAIIRPYSKSAVPLYRRYSLGGIGSIRGFDSYGISLRDPVTKEAIGADKQIKASLNIFFPPPFISSTAGVRGIVFADAATLWGSVSTTVGNLSLSVSEPFAVSRIRYSAGFAIEWASPVGPVGLVWAFPIKTVPGDIERSFEFVLGGAF
ncbi:MAG: outer membrane protein assembly factor BamA [Mariprofundus sp.]|nr:outer membrane protein assembly factor BamA [Mariprofundus sp.]